MIHEALERCVWLGQCVRFDCRLSVVQTEEPVIQTAEYAILGAKCEIVEWKRCASEFPQIVEWVSSDVAIK